MASAVGLKLGRETIHMIAFPQATAQPAGTGAEQGVPYIVSQSVINFLESIQVQKQHCADGILVSFDMVDELLQGDVEQIPIPQVCQLVMIGQILELPLCFLSLADIPDDAGNQSFALDALRVTKRDLQRYDLTCLILPEHLYRGAQLRSLSMHIVDHEVLLEQIVVAIMYGRGEEG